MEDDVSYQIAEVPHVNEVVEVKSISILQHSQLDHVEMDEKDEKFEGNDLENDIEEEFENELEEYIKIEDNDFEVNNEEGNLKEMIVKKTMKKRDLIMRGSHKAYQNMLLNY